MEFTSTLKKNYEFRRLYSKGKSCANAYLVVYCRKNHSGRSRIGYTVSNKVGHAVVRNRIRRRLREAAERALASQTERRCDVVIVARSEVLGAKFQTLVADLSIAIDRAKPHKPREAAFADRRRPPPKRGTPSQA